MEYLEIIKTIQESHNNAGDLYSQLAKTIIKLSKYHSDQIKKIEELEFELISQKIQIQILTKSENPETKSEITPKILKLPQKNEEIQENLKKSESGVECLNLDPTQRTPRSIIKNQNKILHEEKFASGKVSKEKSSIEVSSKFLKKTQPKIQDFFLVKPQNAQIKQVSLKKERKIQVNTRIIVDENGFRSLSHKKSKKINF